MSKPHHNETETAVTKVVDLDGLMMFGYSMAKKIIEEDNQEVSMVFLAQNDKGEITVAMCPEGWRTDAERDALLAKLKVMFKQAGIVRYAHSSEAWCLKTNDREELRRVSAERGVHKHPLRSEIYMLVGVDKDRMVHRTWEIVRTPNNTRKLTTQPVTSADSSIPGDELDFPSPLAGLLR